MSPSQMEARIQELTIQNSALLKKQELYTGKPDGWERVAREGQAMSGQHEQELANLRRERDDAIESRDAACGALEAEKESHGKNLEVIKLLGDPLKDAEIAQGKVLQMEKELTQCREKYRELEKKNAELEAQIAATKLKIEAISNSAHERFVKTSRELQKIDATEVGELPIGLIPITTASDAKIINDIQPPPAQM